MATTPPLDWLSDPVVEFFEDARGRTESAYIALRPGKAVRAIQPSSDHLVFLFLGEDDFPIGVRLLGPVHGAAGTEVLMRLAGGRDGPSDGFDRTRRRDFTPMSLAQLDATLHGLQHASDRLRSPASV